MKIEIRFFVPEGEQIGPFVLDRPVVVGRGETAQIQIPHKGVSSEHCHLEPMADGIALVDLKLCSRV